MCYQKVLNTCFVSYLAMFLFSVFLTACGDGGGGGDGGTNPGGNTIEPTGGPLDAFCPPFNVGDTWTHSVLIESSLGNTSDTKMETVTQNDGSVIKTEYQFASQANEISTDTIYVMNGAAVLVKDNHADGTVSEFTVPWQLCPVSAVGDVFKDKTTDSGTVTSTSEATVLSVTENETLTVPAGNYTTTKVVYGWKSGGTSTFYLASGVGVVKQVDEFGVSTTTSELTSVSF
jgi:hypothetical protein